MIKDTIAELKAIRERVGYSEYDQAVKIISRERLQNSDRDKRKPIPWSVIQRHYKKQRGICPWCNKPMVLIRSELEGDHVDPNRQDFNADDNIQVLHKLPCNREKSSMSVADQAKAKGKTYYELLQPEV